MAWEYWFLFFLILVGILNQFLFDFKSKIHYIFICILLILIGGLRYKLGPDWPAYYRNHEYLSNMSSFNELIKIWNSMEFERGYMIYNYVCTLFSSKQWFFQLALILPAVIIKTRFLYKHLDLYFLGLSFYFMPLFFYQDMVQIRQGYSAAILILATKYIIERKPILFTFFVLIAFQFHSSSIIYILAYFVGNSKLKFNYIIIIVLICMFFSPIGLSKPFSFIIEMIPVSSVKETYLDYHNEDEYKPGYSYNDLVKVLFLIIIMLFNSNTEKVIGRTYIVFRNLFLFSLILYYVFFTEPIFAIRLPAQYFFFHGLVIPQIIYAMKQNKNMYIILYSGIIIYFTLLTFRFEYLNPNFFGNYPNYIYDSPEKLFMNK